MWERWNGCAAHERKAVEMAIGSVDELETMLSEPGQSVVDMMGRLEGDIVALGAGGKMGPSLARMAKRASDAAGTPRRIVAASLAWSDGEEERLLVRVGGICGETVQAVREAELLRQLGYSAVSSGAGPSRRRVGHPAFGDARSGWRTVFEVWVDGQVLRAHSPGE